MKKAAIFGLIFLSGLALLSAPVALAGANCARKNPAACASSSANPCPMHKIGGTKAETASQCGDYKGKCEDLTLTIAGMTDAEAEKAVRKALEGKDGVIKVCSVDHVSGIATICFDPEKTESNQLASFVTDAGYEAEVKSSVACRAGEHKGHSCLSAAKCVAAGKTCGIKWPEGDQKDAK
ncbi:MAG: hypothetical protein JSV44_08460 [Candidatus Zixiibacteriota bacterium]|nr:MAG: hypothetical protein JSV44_08460 [candidate division Zixibacteria bacterium]